MAGGLNPIGMLQGKVDASGALVVALAAGSTPTFASLTLTGGTVTVSTPLLTGTETWNAAGVSFIGASLVFTETADATGSRYFQILGGAAGATDEFYVKKGGTGFFATAIDTPAWIPAGGTAAVTGNFTATGSVASGLASFTADGSNMLSAAGIGTSATSAVYWTSGNQMRSTANGDLQIVKSDASTGFTIRITAGQAQFLAANNADTATLKANKLVATGLPAFVAADKYVVVDSSGNLHVSALGPVS